VALDKDEPIRKDADAAAPVESAPVSAPGPDAGQSETLGGPEQKVEIVEENEGAASGIPAEASEQVQKRTRRTSRRELLGLIQRKNGLLIELDNELKKTKQELKSKEDRTLRLAAEFENYKKRVRREWELLQKQANADLIKEIVGGIDNFDRASAILGEADVQLRDGLQMIHNGLMDILRKAGLTEMDALHQKFDPVVHEAVGEVERADVEEGHVAQVVLRGYRLHDAVLRPARVLISRKKVQAGSS